MMHAECKMREEICREKDCNAQEKEFQQLKIERFS